MHCLQAHVTCWFISGAVRYVTRKPTNEFEANVKGTVGSFSRADVQSMVNVPFSDTVFGRFTAASLSQDGWITQLNGREDLGNRDDKMIRAQIRAEPNDSLTLDFTLDYVDYENDGAAQYMQNPVDTASWYNRYQNFNPQVPDFPVVRGIFERPALRFRRLFTRHCRCTCLRSRTSGLSATSPVQSAAEPFASQ